MAKYVIEIDGPISNWYISKNFINNELKKAGKNEVQVNISSLGGSVDHALAIHEAFVEHGNVTAVLTGFVASSATIIAMGAKHIRMSENAFFLVHKVMTYVDEWGLMNEDDLDKVIETLNKEKEENKKMDLVIARMYARKTGKSIEDVHNLMQKDTWLNAEETEDWGFIDEVYQLDGNDKQNIWEDSKRVAMIAAAGLPLPNRKKQPKSLSENKEELDSALSNLKSEIINGVKKLLPGQKDNSTKNSKQMSKSQKLAALVAVMAVNSIEVDEQQGAYINAEQLEKINQELEKVTALQNKVTTAENERDTVINALDDIDKTVADAEGHEAKINAVKEKLAAKAGTQPTGNSGGDGGKNNADGVDWDAINALPHNQAADEMY